MICPRAKSNLAASFCHFCTKTGLNSLDKKGPKEANKLEFALAQIPEKNHEERQVLVDKIQVIKEVLHESK